MDIDIATLNEPPKIKIDKQSKVKTKKIQQVEYLDQLLSKKWLKDYFDAKKITIYKSLK
jgi:hypothetical protein